MGVTASKDGNLAELSKVSKKSTHKKKPHQVRKPFMNASGDYTEYNKWKCKLCKDYVQKSYGIINLIISKY